MEKKYLEQCFFKITDYAEVHKHQYNFLCSTNSLCGQACANECVCIYSDT